MIVTLFTQPFASPSSDDNSNKLIASWMNAFNKECYFLWSGDYNNTINFNFLCKS